MNSSNVNPTYTCWSRYGAGPVRVQRISKSTNNHSRNNKTGGIKSPKKRILKGDDPFASVPIKNTTEQHIGTYHDVIV